MGCELGQLSRPDLAVLESTPSSCGARVQHTRAGERVTQGAGEGRGEEQEGRAVRTPFLRPVAGTFWGS